MIWKILLKCTESTLYHFYIILNYITKTLLKNSIYLHMLGMHLAFNITKEREYADFIGRKRDLDQN